jgi:hypothetical protein
MKDRRPIHGSGLIAFILQCVESVGAKPCLLIERSFRLQNLAANFPAGVCGCVELKCHLPFTSSLACSDVRVAVSAMGLLQRARVTHRAAHIALCVG